MDWLALILGLVKALGALSSYLHDKGLLDAGKASQIADELTRQSDALSKANAAREAVRSGLTRNPGSILSDDGFKRP